MIPEGEGWGDGIGDDAEDADQDSAGMAEAEKVPLPKLPIQSCPPKRRRLTKKDDHPRVALTGAQRFLLLDTWRRSQLPATDFAPLVGLTKHSLYAWKRRFEDEGPAELADKPRGSWRGSRVPEVTRRSILMLKEDNPDWACQRITDVLARRPGLGVSLRTSLLSQRSYPS